MLKKSQRNHNKTKCLIKKCENKCIYDCNNEQYLPICSYNCLIQAQNIGILQRSSYSDFFKTINSKFKLFLSTYQKQKSFVKMQSQFLINSDMMQPVKFILKRYKISQLKKQKYTNQKLELLDVFDPGKYNKNQLRQMIKQFITNYDYPKFQNQIKTLSKGKYIQNFPFVFEIQHELYVSLYFSVQFHQNLFHDFLNQKKNIQKIRFKNVKDVHICYFQAIMKNQKTRNLTITQKTKLIQDEFPDLQIKRSTVFKIQKKLLRYSYKRVCTYEPKYLGNKEIKRIAFIMKYFKILKDTNSILFVLDEVGFGTSNQRHYAYSKIGEPVVLKQTKKLAHNMTCTATISPFCVEAMQFFTEKGTKNQYFKQYFQKLTEQLSQKYPDKKLVILLDNLASHKSNLIMNIMKNKKLQMLLLPSNSPQFSPIENLFGYTKRKLQDLEFNSTEYSAQKIKDFMFSLNEKVINGFYKKTLYNMQSFWLNLDRNKILQEYDNQ